ncbi:sporulation protein [Nocardia sp. NBC_01329]|uniref:sporulation protein n=1 Tax=Nocardia sp. NBC_01329 TaxID=2903594 RepID=UPI002E136B14|nr:sporulation protein [Nocardia sp. NBC_01329]
MFETLLGALGANTVEVETELCTPEVQPGQSGRGVIRMRCHDRPDRVKSVAAELITRAEREHHDGASLVDMDVVIEADERAALFAPGRDVVDAIRVDFATFEQVDRVAAIGRRLHSLT